LPSIGSSPSQSGALCCSECVELEMGWTTRRAVCHACLRERADTPVARRQGPYWAAAAAIALALAAWLILSP